ncbi:hypothetical protein AOA14_06245 [Sphingopyxis terrae subsp. terrae NBRC 15098]|uniref:Uncharacterized protein n=1 Tax=Sphingopyxis terrae subsp. terrae NBRC 15098 TaxID=1219058 RepID=A0A142VY60_9SPHN|nr:hypothetical protein [Sphingopyxis terrae]AMU94205.1 hypothetical protein AOA14_06245 [Sphingopyxis terrae subsp. terrae NBRC 15098]
MRTAGAVLVALAALLLIIAVSYETTVTSFDSDFLQRETYNLGKLQTQIMFLHAGLGFLITGCILIGFGAVAERMDALNLPRFKQEIDDSDQIFPNAEVIESTPIAPQEIVSEPEISTVEAPDEEITSTVDQRRKSLAVVAIAAIFAIVAFIILKNENLI